MSIENGDDDGDAENESEEKIGDLKGFAFEFHIFEFNGTIDKAVLCKHFLNFIINEILINNHPEFFKFSK